MYFKVTATLRRGKETHQRMEATKRTTKDIPPTMTAKTTATKGEDTRMMRRVTQKGRGMRAARIKRWTTESNKNFNNNQVFLE